MKKYRNKKILTKFLYIRIIEKYIHIMKNYKEFTKLENQYQDDILDKMLDDALPFDKLSKYDQHALKTGEEHPELSKQNEKLQKTFIGIENVLSFILDDVNINDESITMSGTIIYNDDEYVGQLFQHKKHAGYVKFVNDDKGEFDPRNDEYLHKSMSEMFDTAIKYYLNKLEDDNTYNGEEI